MSFTFTKLFSSITESTIWVESDRTRIVWITMLAMADRKGRVWASVPGLANRARVPVEDCRAAIQLFLSPDADSRTPDFEGRRIEVIDGGWRLLNYEKYRAIRDEETILESKRRYINDRRKKERSVSKASHVEKVEQSRPPSNTDEHSRPLSTQAEAEAEADQIEKATPSLLPAKPARVREPIIDALAAVGGSDPTQIPKGAWSGIAKCLADIRTVTPAVDVAEIQRRATNYRLHFQAEITPHALAKHWALCDKSLSSNPTFETLLAKAKFAGGFGK